MGATHSVTVSQCQWYLQEAIRTGEAVDMAALEVPDMESDLTAGVQKKCVTTTWRAEGKSTTICRGKKVQSL